MVKQRKKHSKKKRVGKGFNKNTAIVDNTFRISWSKINLCAIIFLFTSVSFLKL